MSVVLLSSALGFPAAGHPSERPQEQQPLQDFGACISGGGEGRVLFLLDTSASLKASDPKAARIDAALHLSDRLSEFAGASEATLEVAVARFAEGFTVTQGWTELDGGGNETLARAFEQYRDEPEGWETDYWQALQGARAYLLDGSAEAGCSALVWLTDGMYDLDHRSTEAEQDRYGTTKPYASDIELVTAEAAEEVERKGTSDLCRPGGGADALRADGITVLAIGLQGGADSGDFDLMSGVATQSPVDGAACGRRDASGRGSFVLAEDIGDLFFAFDGLADPENLPAQLSTALCQDAICDAGSHRFVTDRSISSVSVMGGADVAGYRAVFVTPRGTQHVLSSGASLEERTPGYTLKARWLTGSVFTASIERGKAGSWSGEWAVVFVDPGSSGAGTARSSIRLVSDLSPVWGRGDDLVTGEQVPLDLGVELADGSRLDPADLAGSMSLDVVLARDGEDPVPLVEGLSAADLGAPVEVDLRNQAPGAAQLRLELNLVTGAARGTGTPLPTRVVSYPVLLQAPGDYPQLPQSIDFGRGDSTDEVVRTISWDGPGCVWLSGTDIEVVPSGSSGASVNSSTDGPEDCAESEIQVALVPRSEGTGLLGGTVMLSASPGSGPGDPIEVPVRFRYEMEPPPNEPVKWAVFVAVLMLGLAVPLGLLAAVKRRAAKLAGDHLAVEVLAGRITASSSFLASATVDRQQQTVLAFDSVGRTRVRVSDRATLVVRARALNPLKMPEVVVEGAPHVTSQGEFLPLAVQGTWLALLDPADLESGAVQVVLLLPVSGIGAEELLRDAADKVPGAIAQLRDRISAVTAPRAGQDRRSPRVAAAGDDDGWGPQPGSGASARTKEGTRDSPGGAAGSAVPAGDVVHDDDDW
ncbi:vWA domain-containing protein [Nocardioides ochotonae]|uniref:vWA domain-containing protein n=1 Tax=Nocardioides ochotonae TaxID=2685869 RepID=UPI00140AC1F8|nr:VWA domain-containing protein [Nocardioides ochotonae]